MSVKFKLTGQDFFDNFNDEPINYSRKTIDFQKVDLTYNDYSKSFMLPATPKNNGLFKHYSDVSVLGGFNPFEKNSCEMWVNGELFSTGAITLLNIDLKDEQPTQYSVQFYSDTIDLKEALQDKGLDQLQWSGLDHAASAANIAGYLAGGAVGTTGLKYVMASVSNFWTWEGGTGTGVREIRSTKDGILNREVRPAILVSDVMDKIFADAGYTYEVDFVGNDYYDELYMWIANGKPFIAQQQQVASAQMSKSQDFTTGSKLLFATEQVNNLKMFSTITSVTTIVNAAPLAYTLYLKLTSVPVTGGTAQWRYVINAAPGSWTNVINGTEVSAALGSLSSGDEVYIEIRNSTGNLITIRGGGEFRIENATASTLEYFETNAYMPTMKCTEFLRGILVTFNAIMYWDAENQKFIIKHRSDWFAAGNEIDISENVDNSKSTIKPPTSYKTYSFGFEEGEDFYNVSYKERNNRTYGGSIYDTGNYTGDIYENKSPFTSAIWSEVIQQNPNGSIAVQSNVASFQCVDSSFSRVDSGVRLMYNHGTAAAVGNYKVVDINGTTGGTPTTTYNQFLGLDPTDSINLAFNSELDFLASGGVLNKISLYTEFYEDYILQIYNQNVRRKSVTAYIPYNKLKTIQSNDTIVIKGVRYWIDGMQVDLTTNKAVFDLINKV